MTASASGGVRVVAGRSDGVVDSESCSFGDDLSFRHLHERGVDRQARSFDPCLGRKVCHRFVGRDEFGSAIGVSGVIECIDSQENVLCANSFRVCQCERQENCVAGGTYVDGMSVVTSSALSCLGTSISEVSAEPPKIRRSMLPTTCRVEPSDSATFRADSSSTLWRCP